MWLQPIKGCSGAPPINYLTRGYDMNNLDFDNFLYFALMEHADVLDETDGQRLAGCSVDQMFDDLYDLQEPVDPMSMTTKRGTYNEK